MKNFALKVQGKPAGADTTLRVLIGDLMLRQIVTKRNWIVLTWAGLVLASPSAFAYSKVYSAGLTNSVWAVTEATPIQCSLDHNIPRFGRATFTIRANKEVNLDFDLDGDRETPVTRTVTLKSVPPSWRPGQVAQDITLLKFHKQFNGYVGGRNAWAMLSELEEGRFPTFIFRDWYNQDQVTQVGISSVNFQNNYDEFVTCVNQLLPYSFEDIAFSVLSYESNGSVLANRSKKRLKMIGDYIKHDESVNIVLIDAYSDSYGGRWHNQQLSESRAKSVQTYLSELGIEKGKVKVTGWGEKRHVANNDTPLGRAKNRRVVISLGREEI